ncbi:FAD-dependent oxidoreductase, partial [Enterobacter ludwigii]|uniref:FAD-dependent oxidoreductase n=1 Tax=Enterobacter ludwigii TaxID=299767 RepID=UPI0034D361E4
NAARAAGAVIREQTEIIGYRRDDAGFVLESRTGEEFRAKVLLNTAGFWGGAVAAAFGETVPIQPLSPNK